MADEGQSLGCAKCGECCTDIRILSSPERIVQAATEEEGNEDAVWIMAHWDPNGRSPTGKGWHYTCRRYDPVHQLCTAWDDRPPVCRRFPSTATRTR